MVKTTETAPRREESRQHPMEIHAHEGAGMHLHTRTVHPALRIPYLTREDVTSTAKAATSRMPGMPSAKDLVFYGGLGAMAAAGALEWPVALAVGGATWLLRGGRSGEGGARASAGHNGEARGPAKKSG
ncbi:hypothetical protein [Streptomyces hygroscopicus]|uniref:hypothetical protein n=1 Tax=Streptomyces hygroscopicus TaxID=1912 RepID=UPI00223FD39B|nr:hypothetical protein [Streptomyces hygroscopicus]